MSSQTTGSEGGYPSNNTDPDLSMFSPLDDDAHCVACGGTLRRHKTRPEWRCATCGKVYQLQWQEMEPTDGVSDEMGMARTEASRLPWRRTFGDPHTSEVQE